MTRALNLRPLIAGAILGAFTLTGPAAALEFRGDCGIGGWPVTGWNGNTDTKTRTKKISCGSEVTITVEFNAEVTQADVDASGFTWRLVDEDGPFDADDILLETNITCDRIGDLEAGDSVVGTAEFTLKCTDDCIVEGVSIDEIELYVWTGAEPRGDKICSIDNIVATTGSSGESEAELALEDVPDEDNHRMCNKLNVQCVEGQASTRWDGDPRLPHGHVGTAMLSADEPLFTDETTMTIGHDGRIRVEALEVEDAFTARITYEVPLSQAPGVVPVDLYDTIVAAEPMVFTVEPERWAHHDAGALHLTVSDQGSLAYLDAERSIGEGLDYPGDGYVDDPDDEKWGGSSSFWCGNSPEYVASRDVDSEDDRDWEPLDGSAVTLIDHPEGAQAILAQYTDAGGPWPMGLIVEQESVAFGPERPELDDVVFLTYRVTNAGPEFLESVYAGVFLDLQAGLDPLNDLGAADPAAHIVWMHDADEGHHVGLLCVKPYDWPRMGGSGPGAGGARGMAVGNLSLVDMARFGGAGGGLTDFDRYHFLGGLGDEYRLLSADVPGDYGVMMSSGPVPLAPGEVREAVFAIVGGATLDEMLASAQSARDWYDGVLDASVDAGVPLPWTPTLVCAPNPSPRESLVRFELAASGPLELRVFDARGRSVRRLLTGSRDAGVHEVGWDGANDAGRPVAGGVYFVRLSGAFGARTERLILTR